MKRTCATPAPSTPATINSQFSITRKAPTAPPAPSTRPPLPAPCEGGEKRFRPNRKSQIPNPKSRSAFTLVELLVAITIILLLSTLVFAVFNVTGSSDRTRSAARIAQSALAGAKDRALHAKDLRGVRLIRDPNDTTLVTGFVYLQAIPPQTAGNLAGQKAQNNVAVTRPNLPGNSSATGVVIAGTQGQRWYAQDQKGLWPADDVEIRIPAQTGNWYHLARQQASPPYWGTLDASGNLNLTLQLPYTLGKPYPPSANAIDFADTNASCEIRLGNDLLPFHEPISLPSAVVIDLNNSSPNVASFWAGGPVPAHIDLMYSPRGTFVGAVAGQGPIHFLLNNIADASQRLNPIDPRNRGDKLVLTVFPQTGNVGVYPIDPTDANQDGLADDLFHFAKIGSVAGQ